MELIRGILLLQLYKLNLKDPVKIIGTMVSWVKGVSETALKDLIIEVFNNHILKSIYPEVKSEINFHQNREQNCYTLIHHTACLSDYC